ncbi:MAG TPA: hypothetical protein VME43_32565 [Bryobacteraceae bacterium]|nr:hypothetical protein [Bryobacteraceae bacterium]
MDDPKARINSNYSWGTLWGEFRRDFPNFILRLRVMDRDQLAAALHSPRGKTVHPDVALIDNYSLVEPLEAANAVIVMGGLAGQIRFNYRGRWLLLRTAKNPAAGREFLRWLTRSPNWKPWRVGAEGMRRADVAAVEDLSGKALRGFLVADARPVSPLMDAEAAHFDLRQEQMKITEAVSHLVTFGNPRLAFALVSAPVEGKSLFGVIHAALILRKGPDGWKVLLFDVGTLPTLEGLLRSLDSLGLEDGKPEAVPKVTLVSPDDHAQVSRLHPGRIQWEPLDPSPAAYLLEWQVSNRGKEFWSPSWAILPPPVHDGPLLSARIPFGLNAQPYRFRIWAVGRTSTISTSAWHTVTGVR